MATTRALANTYGAFLILLVVIFTALNYFDLNNGVVRVRSIEDRVPYPNRSIGVVDGTDLAFTKGHTLTLTVRMETIPKLLTRFYCDLLRSAVLFWSPKLGRISVILNKESESDHLFALRLRGRERELGLKFDFFYEPLPNDTTILKKGRVPTGYTRQLWSSFWMDVFIDASIVAWADTDAIFITPVTPENIFNGQRLRVVAFTDWRRPKTCGWYRTTQSALGRKMVADFMTYFPTYVWRDTITNCRNFVLKQMKVNSFAEAFRKLGIGISPVNIIMNYAYYFEHDRYDWHLDVSNNLKGYNAKYVPRGFEIQPNETVSEVHVTVHDGYFKLSPHPLLQGYCIAKRYTGQLPVGCKQFENTTNFFLFEFETKPYVGHMKAWCSPGAGRESCAQRIEAHYNNTLKYYNAGNDLNLKRVGDIEEAARQENISCPNVFNFG
ncbi:uncharacterized protein LOC110975394 [Acanthaster planci]|uniref:Uncharacterized protein LOC110975394 n=1 Tax=Acanthaster planci TaxID=133434 RepID=A0A8B7XTJ5_ACAPL|nr:uncharacterized protein LOC110975394 [Acanthaster planci]